MRYFPLRYLRLYKRPNRRYFRKQVLYGDFLVLVLAFWQSFPTSLLPLLSSLLGIFFLVYSFWTIYEVGYVENDLLGLKKESKPNLSDQFINDHNNINLRAFSRSAYLFSLFSTVPGLIFMTIGQLRFDVDTNIFTFLNYFCNWLILLFCVRFIFFIYNQSDIVTRVWIFPILQATKTFGFLLIFQTSIMGLLLFLSHTFSRWIPYILYRYGNEIPSNAREFPVNFLRLLVFLSLTFIVLDNFQNTTAEIKFDFLCILLFCFLQSVNDLFKIFANQKNAN